VFGTRETKKAAASKLFPPDLQAPETCEKWRNYENHI